MRSSSNTPTAKAKKEVQRLVRAIVIIRDDGCLLKGFRYPCNEVLQADHMITRGKNIGFADTRLINCLCSAHHTAKTFDKSGEYEEEICRRISKERNELYQRAKRDHKPYPMSAYEWGKEIIVLEIELKQCQSVKASPQQVIPTASTSPRRTGKGRATAKHIS